MKEIIKLFVGCAPNGEDAESQAVLEYTARTHSSLPIDIVWMKISKDPTSFWYGWNTKLWPTPFSGFRWGIPQYCSFKGQAIYMDSDMIVLGDLAELWNAPWEKDKIIQMKGDWRTCVAKWNCEQAFRYILPIDRLRSTEFSHQRMINMLHGPMLKVIQPFDRQWNNFDGENDALTDIKILHYTDMSTQPHIKMAIERLKKRDLAHWYDGDVREHRRKDVDDLFNTYYKKSQECGYLVENYEPAEIVQYDKLSQKGYVAANGFDVTQGQ